VATQRLDRRGDADGDPARDHDGGERRGEARVAGRLVEAEQGDQACRRGRHRGPARARALPGGGRQPGGAEQAHAPGQRPGGGHVPPGHRPGGQGAEIGRPHAALEGDAGDEQAEGGDVLGGETEPGSMPRWPGAGGEEHGADVAELEAAEEEHGVPREGGEAARGEAEEQAGALDRAPPALEERGERQRAGEQRHDQAGGVGAEGEGHSGDEVADRALDDARGEHDRKVADEQGRGDEHRRGRQPPRGPHRPRRQRVEGEGADDEHAAGEQRPQPRAQDEAACPAPPRPWAATSSAQ
jgi:hypothetical protein